MAPLPTRSEINTYLLMRDEEGLTNTETRTTFLNSKSNYESTRSNPANLIEIMDPISIPNIIGSETSGPPSPIFGPIPNFGVISTGLYRSSFPHPENIEHLQSLNLKTLITLVDTTFDPQVETWLTNSGIEHHCFNIPAHKTPNDPTFNDPTSNDPIPMEKISMEDIAKVMTLLNDETKRPLLIHCNKGKHRTGCMVAAFRKLQGTEENQIVADYHEFAQPKARELDIAFIRKLNPGVVRGAMEICKGDIGMTSNGIQCNSLERETASTGLDGLVDEDGFIGDHKWGSAALRLLAMGSGPPLSPPPNAACKVGHRFTVEELVDACWKNLGRTSPDELSPPETP